MAGPSGPACDLEAARGGLDMSQHDTAPYDVRLTAVVTRGMTDGRHPGGSGGAAAPPEHGYVRECSVSKQLHILTFF